MTTPLLCVTVAARSLQDLRRQRDEAFALADLVELRLDALPRPDVDAALEGRRGPVIVTCRPRWEGGGFDGPEEMRLGLLHRAAELGAEFVDVEWQARDVEFVRARRGRGIVLSMHDFEGTPRDLAKRAAAMAAAGPEIVKLAITATSLGDTLRLRQAGHVVTGGGALAALVAMGPRGLATRILPGRFGSRWTYAGEQVAPGQMTAARLVGEFRFREVGPATAIYGLAGCPVGHSLSPAMHNAAFRAAGVDAVYVPLEAEDPADLTEFAASLGLAGASVTAPLKVAMRERVHQPDLTSQQVGAVNTIRWRDRLEGCNTDVAGFLAPLADEAMEGARAAVLGTGGAARAVVVGLGSRGARVTVYGREATRAAAVAALAGGEGRAGLPAPGAWDILVNATPVGTFPAVHQTPLPAASLRGGRLVYDLVYNPARTVLMRDAEQAGCRAIGGLEMLVAQAGLQFTWWTGMEAPVEVMRAAAAARLHAMTDPESMAGAE